MQGQATSNVTRRVDVNRPRLRAPARVLAFLVAVSAALLLFSASALARAPVLQSVTDAGSGTGTVTWTLQSGVQSRLVELARNPTTDQNGYFRKGLLLLDSSGYPYIGILHGEETSWNFALPTTDGTYYVHVGGQDTDNFACPQREFTHTFAFTVEGGAVTHDEDVGGGSPPCPVPGGGGSGGGGGGGVLKKVGSLSERLVAPRVQRLGKLYVLLQLNKPARLTVGGTVNVPGGAARVYRFKTQRRKAVAHVWVRVRLRLSKKGRRAALAALHRGKRLRAKIKVTARGDGHRLVQRKTIRLRA
jgi:hypothetical protein